MNTKHKTNALAATTERTNRSEELSTYALIYCYFNGISWVKIASIFYFISVVDFDVVWRWRIQRNLPIGDVNFL